MPTARDWHQDVEAIEPAQLRELQQITHATQIGLKTARRQEPAHVRANEAVLYGRVRILGFVGVGVVVTMMRRPPERPALHRRRADDAKDELPHPRGLEGTVREVAVIEPGDGKHAHDIGEHGHHDGHGAPTDPDHGQTGGMDGDEGNDSGPLDPVRNLGQRRPVRRSNQRAGIEPVDEGAAQSAPKRQGRVAHV